MAASSNLRAPLVLLAFAVGCGGGARATSARVARLDAPAFRPEQALLELLKPPAAATKAPSAAAIEPSAGAESPPAEPAYDLAADIEVRKREAEQELGAKSAIEIVEGVFVVASPKGRGSLASAVAVTKLALRAYFNGRFTRRPERAITVYLFADAAPYDAWCKKRWNEECGTPFGFYLHDERRIVMNVGPGIGTLTHELVHPLVAVDFPSAPDWINEGIASLFEQPYLGKQGEIHGGKNWRHPRLLRALHSKIERGQASLPALFAMSDATFRGELESLNYATARYFCQWLDQKKLLWAFYQRWRDGYADDPSGERAFTAVVGKTPAEADAEWAAWVRAL